jgi:REP element-mobilizing transposase RayT
MLPAERNPRVERVEFELRASGVKPEGSNTLRSGTHTRGYLPHVKREGAAYFLTFRLADSLPRDVLLKFGGERAERLNRYYAQQEARRKLGESVKNEEDIEAIERDFRRKIERFLDNSCGECWLRRPDLADSVASALRFFEGERYRLDAWVVMPNHVHAVVWPMPNHTLSVIAQSWKRFTAREANKLLNRTGQPFWQPETFDHWIWNEEEHARCCRYTTMNPVKAGLCSSPEAWRWSSMSRGALPLK